MVYTTAHDYLTVHWTMTSGNIEEGQFGIRFAGAGAAVQADLDAVVTTIGTYWASANAKIGDDYRLASVKIARIGTDGLYPSDSVPLLHDFSPIIPGGTSLAISQFPLQVATVVSLTTSAIRGRAHRGRVYNPPIAGNLDANYLFSETDAQTKADAFLDLVTALNNDMPGDASVMSRLGTGTTRAITGVEVGTRPDVQRRRAGRQAETYMVGV